MEITAVSSDIRTSFGIRRRLRRVRVRLQLLQDSMGPMFRRFLDVLATGGGLLCLSPLFVMTALAIRLESKGPVFYAQERIGKDGRRFKMWKFRSMVQNAEALKSALIAQQGGKEGDRFKMVHDPRITKVGRFIRKYSIDGLPQLWNVLIGDMTLIGPRPPVWREVAKYNNKALRRLEVKPGLTCLWQIGGRSDLTFDQQVDLDTHYIDRTKPTEEVMVFLKTIPAVVLGKGAY